MNYTVLSPWAEVSSTQVCALNPRLDTLNGRTIGMFSHFKGHSPYILREVEKEILKKYPEARFSYLQYPKDTREIKDDAEFQPAFKAWLDGVDGVIAAYGDAGSCAMYHAFNTAYVERCGKPAVMLTKGDIFMSAQRGASARHVPHLRFVKCTLQDLSFVPALDEALINDTIRPAVVPVVDQLIDGLLRPLTEEEKATPEVAANQSAREAAEEIRQRRRQGQLCAPIPQRRRHRAHRKNDRHAGGECLLFLHARPFRQQHEQRNAAAPAENAVRKSCGDAAEAVLRFLLHVPHSLCKKRPCRFFAYFLRKLWQSVHWSMVGLVSWVPT